MKNAGYGKISLKHENCWLWEVTARTLNLLVVGKIPLEHL